MASKRKKAGATKARAAKAKVARRAPSWGAAPPKSAVAVGRMLSKRAGVLGVFWGRSRTGGVWRERKALCIHVERKWAPPKGAIRRSYHGIPTDVLEVGGVRYHGQLDTTDRVKSDVGGALNFSTLSALARSADGSLLGLLSGHGTLRKIGDGFESGPWQASEAPSASVIDDGMIEHAVQLLDGAVTPRLDFALGRLPNLDAAEVVLGHRLRGLPIPVRNGRPKDGEELRHFSPKRARTVRGEVVQHAISSALSDGVGIEIHGVIVVRGTDAGDAFSVVTDSGSLAFDAQGNAVGFVVAGSLNHAVSYVLPINGTLQKRLGPLFKLFFEVQVSS